MAVVLTWLGAGLLTWQGAGVLDGTWLGAIMLTWLGAEVLTWLGAGVLTWLGAGVLTWLGAGVVTSAAWWYRSKTSSEASRDFQAETTALGGTHYLSLNGLLSVTKNETREIQRGRQQQSKRELIGPLSTDAINFVRQSSSHLQKQQQQSFDALAV